MKKISNNHEKNKQNPSVNIDKEVVVIKRIPGPKYDTLLTQPVKAATSSKTTYRTRLFSLFAEIEKEFDTLYEENIRLKEQLSSLKKISSNGCNSNSQATSNNNQTIPIM